MKLENTFEIPNVAGQEMDILLATLLFGWEFHGKVCSIRHTDEEMKRFRSTPEQLARDVAEFAKAGFELKPVKPDNRAFFALPAFTSSLDTFAAVEDEIARKGWQGPYYNALLALVLGQDKGLRRHNATAMFEVVCATPGQRGQAALVMIKKHLKLSKVKYESV